VPLNARRSRRTARRLRIKLPELPCLNTVAAHGRETAQIYYNEKMRIRDLGKESAIYGLSTVLARLLNFFLLPVYTRAFAPEQHGVVAAVYSYVAFLGVIFQFGMDQAYMRLSVNRENDEKTVFSTAFWPVIAASAALAALLCVLRGPAAVIGGIGGRYSELVAYAAIVLAMDAAMCVPFAKLRMEHRALRYASIRAANIAVNLAATVILLLKLKTGPEGALMASVAASAASLVLLTPVITQSLRWRFSKEVFREMLAFSWPLVPAGLAAMAVQVIDRPILLFLTNQSTVGIYQAGYRLGIFMMLVVSMFDQAWRPFFLEHAGKPGAPEVFARVFNYFAAFGAFVVLALSFFIGDIVRLDIGGWHLIDPRYWGGLPVVPVVLAGYLFYGFYVNFLAGPVIAKKTKIIAWTTAVGALSNIAANLLLIPKFSFMGAAWATFISYALMAAVMLAFSRKLYPVPYDFSRAGQALMCAGALWLAQYAAAGVFCDMPARILISKAVLAALLPILLWMNGYFKK